MTKENKLITDYRGDFVYAGMVKSLLEDSGITAFLENGAIETWLPGCTGALGVFVTVS